MNRKIILSKRLQALAELVRYSSVCDIGTDHGLLPVYLADKNIVKKAAACDVNAEPLAKASALITQCGLGDIIETRLADGLNGVERGEFESCVIAGMGGMLITDIIRDNLDKAFGFKQLILLPHTDVPSVRRFLHKNGFCINDEIMVFEAGKWYNILDCSFGNDESYREIDYLFGKHLIDKKSRILRQYLLHEKEKTYKILEFVKNADSDVRKTELERYIKYCGEAEGCL